LLGQVGVGTGVALVRSRRGWLAFQSLAALGGILAFVAIGLLPALGAGPIGAASSAGVSGTLVSLLATALLFAAMYEGLMRALNPNGPLGTERGASRRAFLKHAAIGAGALALGAAGFAWLAQRAAPPAARMAVLAP